VRDEPREDLAVVDRLDPPQVPAPASQERRLRSDAYQGRMAAAILGGLKRYLAANPPLARGPRLAQTTPAAR